MLVTRGPATAPDPFRRLRRATPGSHAYQSDEARPARLRWAKLSLNANARLPGDTPWSHDRKVRQNLALRT